MSVWLMPSLDTWPLDVNAEGRIACGAGCDPEWTWDGNGQRCAGGQHATVHGFITALCDHIRHEHRDGAPCT